MADTVNGKSRKEIIEEYVLKRLREMYPFAQDSDKHFSIELFDNDPTLNERTLNEILEGKTPRDTLVDKLMEWFQDAMFEARDEEAKKFKNELNDDNSPLPGGLTDDEEDVLDDIVSSCISFDPPIKAYLADTVPVNVFLDTGDANFDFVLNDAYPHYNGSSDEPIDKRAGLVWLAEQQGYSREQLWDVLLNGTDKAGFLRSCREEVLNASSSMQIVTFLVMMTVEQVIAINAIMRVAEQYAREHKCGSNPRDLPDFGRITLDKDVVIGLFSNGAGAGGLFEIELDRDVEIPIAFIHSAMPDGGHGESVRETFGMDSRWYKPALKDFAISEPFKESIKDSVF